VKGEGVKAPDPVAAMRQSYHEKVTDEFVKPTVIVEHDKPVGPIRDGDVVMFFNFRADRARELTQALAFPQFKEFDRGPLRLGMYLCMTQYDEKFDLPVAFPPDQPREIFPEVLAQNGLRQFRTAETEKYAHVTFFFNGGREVVYPGEERFLVPSPRDVKTYDQKPEMSAREVTAGLVTALDAGKYDFALVNLANPDMVGHTGDLKAAIKAVETVDTGLGRIVEAIRKAGGALLVTADHGNCETMRDPETGEPHTAHTTNPVPILLVNPPPGTAGLKDGRLCEVAPTLLQLLRLPQPKAMTGRALLALSERAPA
jgi:2,3-bisphosphoglycerate-independent phosphoglycerate mutase